jgi:zinc and cadmium transporter
MGVEVWLYSLISVAIVSIISLIGVLTLSLSDKVLRKILLFLVSFAAGSLFGGAFFHLIPEAFEDGCAMCVPVYVILGILIFFVLEKFIHWRHCHIPTSKHHQHPFGIMNLVGDGFHNLIDGLIIGGSYLVSIPLGFTTTIAIILHEVPQEIGDFGILLHAGFSKAKALLFNFLSALTAVLGVVIAILIGTKIGGFTEFLVPFTAGGFIYIAGSDLIPELQKECAPSKSFIQLIALLLGIGIMIALTFI